MWRTPGIHQRPTAGLTVNHPEEIWKGSLHGLDVAIFTMPQPEGPENHPSQPIELVGFARQRPTVAHPNTGGLENLKDFRLVGGGAKVDYGDGFGSMLTAIYPQTEKRWIARAKDHLDDSPATIRAYCIGARLADRDVHIQTATGHDPHKKSVEASLPKEFALVGGGANASYYEESDAGTLLTASTPNTKTWASWIAQAKDHEIPSPVVVKAYAIGIRKTTLVKHRLKVIHATNTGALHHYPWAQVGLEGLVTCGGAEVQYGSGPGNMLTASWPYRHATWRALGKDHGLPNRAVIKIALLGLAPA